MEEMYIAKDTRLTSVVNETKNKKLSPIVLLEDVKIRDTNGRVVEVKIDGDIITAICGKNNRITKEALDLRNSLLSEKELLNQKLKALQNKVLLKEKSNETTIKLN